MLNECETNVGDPKSPDQEKTDEDIQEIIDFWENHYNLIRSIIDGGSFMLETYRGINNREDGKTNGDLDEISRTQERLNSEIKEAMTEYKLESSEAGECDNLIQITTKNPKELSQEQIVFLREVMRKIEDIYIYLKGKDFRDDQLGVVPRDKE